MSLVDVYGRRIALEFVIIWCSWFFFRWLEQGRASSPSTKEGNPGTPEYFPCKPEKERKDRKH
jgi:hypothetical protein